MSQFFGSAAQIVSSSVYALILSSPDLREALIPEGLVRSPYEILDYEATLILHDAKGAKATFRRRQTVRFLQNGVSAILDHAWGNGVLVTNYWNSAGSLEDSFKDQGTRHLVVGLGRARGKGEVLSFEIERTAMEGFTDSRGRVETAVDHPVNSLRRTIVFPRNRPVQRATFSDGLHQVRMPIAMHPDGRTSISVQVSQPTNGVPYAIDWSW